MPKIAELREIDGAVWARVEGISHEAGRIQLLSDAEIEERRKEIERLYGLLAGIFALADANSDAIVIGTRMHSIWLLAKPFAA